MPASRLYALLIAIGSVALLSACAAAPRERPVKMGPVDKGPGTLAAARSYLEGRWSLLSYEVMPPGVSPISVEGSGTLNYDAYGNLDVEIRTTPEIAERLAKAGVPSDQGVISTKGRAVVDMQAHTLTYVLEGQPAFGAPSGPLAMNRPRYWQVEGNVLTLTTKDADGRPLAVGRWQKSQ